MDVNDETSRVRLYLKNLLNLAEGIDRNRTELRNAILDIMLTGNAYINALKTKSIKESILAFTNFDIAIRVLTSLLTSLLNVN